MTELNDQKLKADLYNELGELLEPHMECNGDFLPEGIYESVQILLQHRLATPTAEDRQRTLANLGQRLAEERNALRLSQVDFARKGHVSVSSQIAFEQGKKEPSLAYLMQLAPHGVNTHYVITGSRT